MDNEDKYIIYKISENGKYFTLHPVGYMDLFHASEISKIYVPFDGDKDNITDNINKEIRKKMGFSYRLKNRKNIELVDENSEKGQELKNKFLLKCPKTEDEAIKFAKELYDNKKNNVTDNPNECIAYYNAEREMIGYIVTAYNMLSESQDEYAHEISLLIENNFPNIYHYTEEGNYIGPIKHENGWTP